MIGGIKVAKFAYEAINPDTGDTITGSIEAKSQDEALEKIEAQSLSPFNLKEEKDKQRKKKFIFPKRGENLILFTHQLANLLKAGVQLGEALEIVHRLLKPSELKNIIKNIYDSIKSGKNFAESLANYPNYFSSSYINIIKAGEEGGFLDSACQRLAKDLEDDAQLKSFVISCLIYPAILSIVAILAIIVMITYVLPKFLVIYDNYGQTLPFTTEILLNISQFLSNYWIVIVLALITIAIVSWKYYRSKEGKVKVDGYILSLPIVSDLIVGISVAKISRSIGTMLESGVPLLKALQLSQHISNNIIIRQALEEASLEVKKGRTLSEALNKREIFPEILIYMIGVGEKTGRLGAMLLEVAKNFERDSKKNLEKFMKAFEPLLILFMGLMIGFIIISILLPILGISNLSL